MIDLTNYYCAFSHSNGTYLRYFKLNADGKIIDIDTEGHDNERYWEIKDEQLILYNNRSIRTSIFLFNSRLTNYYNDIYIVLDGIYKDEIPLKIIAVKNKDDVLLSRTRYRSWKYIKRGILNVGDYTVGKIRIIGDLDIGKITIGNYTTISDNVIFNFDNFDISNISSYNFEKNMLISHKKESQEKRKKKNSTNEIIIGNDVFISENVEILSGSKIGDGAIILPNSKVNKSIEPYSINSGSPCVIKGYRYSIENIKKMEKLQWWNWDKAVINSRIADLSSEKIDDFITKYYKFTV